MATEEREEQEEGEEGEEEAGVNGKVLRLQCQGVMVFRY